MEETIEYYKKCIKQLLSEYETWKPEWVDADLLFDDERMHYMVVWVGWFEQRHIHQCLVHIDIEEDGVIMIQANNTENLVSEELVEMGIPLEKIQIGFIPPEFRALGEQETAQEQREAA